MKNTIVHDNSRQRTIHHFKPPGSSIDGAASKVVRYQKYAVSEERAHSSTICVSLPGHDAQGKGYYNRKPDD